MGSLAEVVRTRIGVATYVAPPGALIEEEAVGNLQQCLNGCVGAGEVHLVLDFSNVTLIGSMALEMLLDTHDQVTRLGGRVTIANANGTLRDVLMLTGTSTWIPVVDDSGEGGTRSHAAPREVPRARLGDLLVERGLVSEKDVARAVEAQARTGRRLGDLLLESKAIAEHDMLAVLAEQMAIPFVRLRTGLYDPKVVGLLSRETARRLNVVPLFKVRGVIHLGICDPHSIPSLDAVEELTRCKVKPVLACTEDITRIVNEADGAGQDLAEYIGSLDVGSDIEVIDERQQENFAVIDEFASASPVINLINGLIQRAVRDGASDIHLEPGRGKSRVRFRIDGVLYPVMSPPLDVYPALISRLKVMANLDISERRLPQDGRIQVYTGGRTIDLRFSSLPGIHGEKVVLRVLDKGRALKPLDQIGMSDDNSAAFRGLLGVSNGLILVTGPTGSGKTTTLYAAISHLNSVERSIVTIEDPVEYQLDIINQNQVHEQVGLSFARLLKHVLRQDPDIIMVGEIREAQTAEIAVQAALTGHLVLSTLHTNDSAGAITRLLDMGIEPYLLSSALIGVVAQRLLRAVCPDCRTSYAAQPGTLSRFGVEETENVRLVRGRGCPNCYDSGYKGRLPVHELLACDAETQRLMIGNPTREALAEHLAARNVATLRDAGMACALAGKTSVEEVARVVNA